MTRLIYLVGGGGFGREAADVVEAAGASTADDDGWTIAGVYDDGLSQINQSRLAARGIPFLGPIPSRAPAKEAAVIVAIGTPAVRHALVPRLAEAGWVFPSVIHPSAVIGSDVAIGAGVVICGGVQVSTNVHLGNHSHVNPGAVLGHDAVLGEFVSINPGAVVSGEVRIGSGALIGAGATVLQGRTVGPGATVGAMGCVVRDVSDNTVVKGVPAR